MGVLFQCFACCSACAGRLKDILVKVSGGDKKAKKQELQPVTESTGASIVPAAATAADSFRTRELNNGDDVGASDEEQSGENSGSASRGESSDSSEGERGSSEGEEKTQGALEKPLEMIPSPLQEGFEWKPCADAPVRMKNAQAVFLNGEIHVGGGYTGIADTDPVVFTYDPNFDLWGSLPASPMKWFGLAVFGEQLVVVGGKEVEAREFSTNKLAVWDKDSSSWTFPFPPMLAVRTSPTVFSYKSYLVAAGGKRGVLDYNVEILDGGTMQWFQGPPLPLPSFLFTSLVHNDKLYLLGEREKAILSVDIETLIKHAKEYADQPSLEEEWIWQKIPNLPAKAFRITSVGDRIITFVHNRTSGHQIDVFVYSPSASQPWAKIPLQLSTFCSNSTSIVTPRGRLYLIGGDSADFQYSNKIYKVSFQESPTLKTKQLRVMRTVMF